MICVVIREGGGGFWVCSTVLSSWTCLVCVVGWDWTRGV